MSHSKKDSALNPSVGRFPFQALALYGDVLLFRSAVFMWLNMATGKSSR